MELYLEVTHESLLKELNKLGDLVHCNDLLQNALLFGLQNTSSKTHTDISCDYDVIDRSVRVNEDSIQLGNKMDKLQESVNDMLNKFSNSKTKGIIGENLVAHAISESFPGDRLEVTANTPDSGDFHLHIQEGGKILIDAKLYNHPVPSKEIEKLKKDMENCSIPYAVLISMNSSISTKRKLDIEQTRNGFIVFMGHSGADHNSISLCIHLMKQLMNIPTQNATFQFDKITKHIYENSENIIDKIISMNRIKQSLKNMQSQQNDILNSIYRETNQIQSELHTLVTQLVHSDVFKQYMKEWTNNENDIVSQLNTCPKVKHMVHDLFTHMKENGIDLFNREGNNVNYSSSRVDCDVTGKVSIFKTKLTILNSKGVSLSLEQNSVYDMNNVMQML